MEKKQSTFPSSRGASLKVASALRDFGAGLENCFGCFLFLPVGFVFEALLWLIAVFSPPVWLISKLIADFVSHGVYLNFSVADSLIHIHIQIQIASLCMSKF